MYLTWIYSQFHSTPQDHYNIITGSQLFEHYKKILQRGWKALRIASYLPFILFPDCKRRKSSRCCRRQRASRGKWSPAFLVGHRGALGDLDFAGLSFLLGTVFWVQDSALLVPVCTEGGEIQVSDGALLCNSDAPVQLDWAGTTRVGFFYKINHFKIEWDEIKLCI